ncbi:MAG: IS200/IS605 family transposase [Lentisphaeria bacterium]|nr:IS200/IS605 family transposase [Lentisphaeria bacterium]
MSISTNIIIICLGISGRYEILFVEIGMEENHVHFLVQSVSALSVTQIVKTIKSITAKQIFQLHPEVKRFLWGGNLWTSGFYANTVSEYANAEGIRQYIANQGAYKKILVQQLTFDL